MTSPTLASLGAYLSRQCGATMAACGLDGTAASAAYLNPVTSSALALGLSPADPMAVSDADLAAFPFTARQVAQLRDVAEYLSLRLAAQSNVDVDEVVSFGGQKLTQVRKDLISDVLPAMAARLREDYGYGLPTDAACLAAPPADDPRWRTPRDHSLDLRRVWPAVPPGSAPAAPVYGNGPGDGSGCYGGY